MSEKNHKQYEFRFKQFSISHCNAAMKVGTDGVLLGAWIPLSGSENTIWDIGCGSGLIGLMLAQRTEDARILGFEIEPHAAVEAMGNVEQSPWSDRITILEADATDLPAGLPIPDLIVSNPPFFTERLQAPDENRRLARHEATFGVEALIRIAAACLSDAGRLCFIAPSERAEEILFAASIARLYPRRRTEVISREGKPAVRTLWELSRKDGMCIDEKLSIRNADNEYSIEYKDLTNEFYTHLK